MAKFLRIAENGERGEVIITGDVEAQLGYIRIALGCDHFEGYGCGKGVQVYVDEDAKAKGKARNELATRFFRALVGRVGRAMLPGDYIAGPALFFGADSDGNEVDLPADALALVEQLAGEKAPA